MSQALDCQRLVNDAVTSLGRLDVLINMASVYSSAAFERIDEAAWDSVIDVDLKGAFLCARAALAPLRAAGGGRIINFTDWVAASGRPRYKGYVPYYVAKRGIIGLTEALALELASDQILVNAIAPGVFRTALNQKLLDENERGREFLLRTPMKRFGNVEELAGAAVFLSSAAASFITGEVLVVDGGFLASGVNQ